MQFVGTWQLVTFDLEKAGVKTPWGKELRGLLIYAPSGHMSVSINKAVEKDPDQSDAENWLDSILFYSGTYTVQGDVIRHQVTNASGASRIGKEMIRYAKVDGDLLTLTSPEESFGRAVLVWKKV